MKNIIDLQNFDFTEGEKVSLKIGDYALEKTLEINKNVYLSGENWAYPSDPNGVFEGKTGVKLKANGFPAVTLKTDSVLGGITLKKFGVQGSAVGMDTRGFFDLENPFVNAGLFLEKGRFDQCEFSKISVTGSGVGVCVGNNSEIDGCSFNKINVDGNTVGIYFCPKATYYARISECIVADNPEYGLYAVTDGNAHNLRVTGCDFVRNGGAFSGETPKVAVYIKGFNNLFFEGNTIDMAGTFWYYYPTDKSNDDRKPSASPCTSVYIEGNGNYIANNRITNGNGQALIIKGDNNLILGGKYDSEIVIHGNGNTVNGAFFTGNGKLIISSDATDTFVTGVKKEIVVDNGKGTVI